METRAWLGLGANEGDREGNLRRALERLEQTPGIAVVAVSTLRETAPEGGGELAPFLNGACEVATTLEPHALLAVCKALEREAGRTLPAPRNAPRPLDLDLLLYGERTVDSPDLVVPHPALFDRAFMLDPLRELGVDLDAVPRPDRPEVIADPEAFAARCSALRNAGCRLGLVPTMGALHEGHLSLVRAALAGCDRVAVTLFVNPLQFGASEDLARYPRPFDADLAQLQRLEAHLLFAPSPEAMFPPGCDSRVAVGAQVQGMESACRPDHFSGVVTVVARLFALARPHKAYFGRKDAEQVAVLRRMTAELGFPTEIVECPVVREPDGLALSSRNVFLDGEDRAAAGLLHRALSTARRAFAGGERDREALLVAARAVLDGSPRIAPDYLELRRERDLLPLPPGPVAGGRLLVAARVGPPGGPSTRLIDNLSLVGPPDGGSP